MNARRDQRETTDRIDCDARARGCNVVVNGMDAAIPIGDIAASDPLEGILE